MTRQADQSLPATRPDGGKNGGRPQRFVAPTIGCPGEPHIEERKFRLSQVPPNSAADCHLQWPTSSPAHFRRLMGWRTVQPSKPARTPLHSAPAITRLFVSYCYLYLHR